MRDLSTGPVGWQIFKFALPMLVGNVFQQLYNVVDTIILGKFIGTDALAAAGVSFPIIFVLVSLVIGITTGANITISYLFGAKDYAQVKRAIDTTFIFLFFSSLLITAFGLLFIDRIWVMIDLPDYLLADATLYFNIYAAGMVFMFGYNGVSAVLRGLGDSKTPLYFLIVASIVNILLDLLFVLVFDWGIAGVAIATVAAQAISFGLSVWYLNRNHRLIRFSHKGMVFDKGLFWQSLRIGIPTGLQHTFVALGMMALLRFVNGFGSATIAAYTIAGRIDTLAAIPAINFSMALSTFVGQNMGANRPDRVKEGLRKTLLMSSGVSLIATLFVWIFGRQLMAFFTPDPEVIEIGYRYLVIVGSFYIFFSAMFATNGLLRGAGDAIVPMVITLISLWVLRVPLSYMLSMQIGPTGIWWSIPLAWLVGWFLAYIYYKSGRWKSNGFSKKIS